LVKVTSIGDVNILRTIQRDPEADTGFPVRKGANPYMPKVPNV
jgi:hypothetical protein